jgi:hypothetical protein
MIEFPGFCGPSYSLQSLNANAQMCKNWYPERDESGTGKAQWVLNPTPGLALFCALGGSKTRGQVSINGRTFAVVDANFFEISAAGVGSILNPIIPMSDDTFLCSFAVSATQILIASAGLVYLFTLKTNLFQAIDPTKFDGNVSQVHYVDGFFVAVMLNSQKFQFSGILDGAAWDALDFNVVSVLPDNIVGSIADHRELVLMGGTKTTVYQNTGDALDPFQVVGSGSFIEQGTEARFSPARLDNSIFWLGGDDRGAGVAWKAQGYQPTRISNHAVENEWQSYPTRADAIGFAYQDQGHNFYQLYFPTADKTWRYDVENGMWCQVTSLLANRERAHLSQSHTYCFGKHLVGDWNSGNIYQMAIPQFNFATGQWNFADDVGAPIRRVRRAPYIHKNQGFIFFHRLQIDAESGLGPQPPLQGMGIPTIILLADANGVVWNFAVQDDGNLRTDAVGNTTFQTLILNDPGNTTTWGIGVTTGGLLTTTALTFSASNPTSKTMNSFGGTLQWSLTVDSGGMLSTTLIGVIARDPQMMLRWSDTSTKTWSNEYLLNAGQAGEFTKRLIKRMMGRGRQRVYEVSTTDPIAWRLAGAYLDITLEDS